MRRMKFRARHQYNRRWYYGDSDIKTNKAVLDGETTIDLGTFWLMVQLGMLEPETVGEWMNKTDSNGRDIYSDDVIDRTWYTCPYPDCDDDEKIPQELHQTVKFQDYIFWFTGGNFYDNQLWMVDSMDITVIGNIHDNPALMEVKT